MSKDKEYEVIDNKKDILNFMMGDGMKFYKQINPHQITFNNNVIYFNTNQDYNDNAYPEMLVDLYQEGSGVHSALVNLKKDLLIGNNLQTDDPQTLLFLKKKNSNNENMYKIWEKMCMDYSIFEQYSLQTIYNKGGKLHELTHQDVSKVRAVSNTRKDIDISVVKDWLISNDWAKITNTRYKVYTTNNSAAPIRTYNPENWSEDGGVQLLMCKSYTPVNQVYAIPSYQSVLNYIQLSKELANFHLNKVTGGMFANAIVYLPGNPNDEDKKKFVNDFKRKYQGADKEKLMFIWGNYSEDQLPKVIPFSTEDQEDVFSELNDIITQHIVTAHRATPELAGIQTQNASLGGDLNKLIAARQYYIKTVIEPMRKVMLNSLNEVLEDAGLGEVYVENDVLTIENNNNNQNTEE